MSKDYSALDEDTFFDLLMEVLEDTSRSEIITIPGVYELVSEHFNNDVLALWDRLQEMEEEQDKQDELEKGAHD